MIPIKQYKVTSDFVAYLDDPRNAMNGRVVPVGTMIRYMGQITAGSDIHTFQIIGSSQTLHAMDVDKYVVRYLNEVELQKVSEFAQVLYARSIAPMLNDDALSNAQLELLRKNAITAARYWIENT